MTWELCRTDQLAIKKLTSQVQKQMTRDSGPDSRMAKQVITKPVDLDRSKTFLEVFQKQNVQDKPG